MANFEIVVRPAIFPDIRPAPAQPALAPADDPNQGFATIRGNGAKEFQVSESYSATASTSQRNEYQRRVDEVRVYQMDDSGKVNKKNFVDLDVTNKMWMKGPPAFSVANNDVAGFDIAAWWGGIDKHVLYYAHAEPGKNIEIRKKNLIKKKGDNEHGSI